MAKIKNMSRCIICFVMVAAMTFTLFSGHQAAAKTQNISLNYSWYSMNAGNSVKLKVKGTSKKVKWKSSNKKVATVTSKGKVKAKKAGKCTITAKVNSKKLKCKITVTGTVNKAKKFTKTTVNILSLKLNLYDIQYDSEGKTSISDKKGTYKLNLLNSSGKATWKTSNAGVATVDNGKVTAIGKGKCTISAVVNKTAYKCSVVVTDLKDAEQITTQKYIYEMLAYINKDRVKAKAAPLKINENVNKVAALRAKEIATKNNFSHTRPNGKNFSTAYADTGMKVGSKVGENAAYYSDSVDEISKFVKNAYEDLYNQKEHRELMLNPSYEYIGIGYKKNDNYKNANGTICADTYWIQEFYNK